jgi:transcriptional regulator with XRE-family HTH domain
MLDQFVAPWPRLVKRLRFLSTLKQADLAEKLGVDQTSVSRWERGLSAPDFPVQKRLRDMLRRAEPVINRSFIEHAPGLVVVARVESTGNIFAGSAAFGAAFQLSPAECRDRVIYDLTSEGGRAALEAIDATPEWRHGEISMWSATLRRVDGKWTRFTNTPIGGSGSCMSIGHAVSQPDGFTSKDFEITFTPYDELCQ